MDCKFFASDNHCIIFLSELSTIGAMQLDDCSHSTITVSHPGINSNLAEVVTEFSLLLKSI